MPLYNPYIAPTPPEEQPAVSHGRPRKKNLTLEQMLKHPNPKVRRAAQKSQDLQTAINTFNTAVASGVAIPTFLSQNPEIADRLKASGIEIPGVSSKGSISQPTTEQKPFWTYPQFKEIMMQVNEARADMRMPIHLPKSPVQVAREKYSVRNAEANQRAARNVSTATAAILINAPSATKLDKSSELYRGAKLPKAKTIAIPKYGEKDTTGAPVFEPFRLDRPEEKGLPIKETSEYKEYAAEIKKQKLPGWREAFELTKFVFFKKVGQIGEGFNNLTAFQKDYVTQGDTPTVVGSAFNYAYNTILFAGAKVRDMYYDATGGEAKFVALAVEMDQMAATAERPDEIANYQQAAQYYRDQAAKAAQSNTYLAAAEAARQRSWENYQRAKEFAGAGFFDTGALSQALSPEQQAKQAEERTFQAQNAQFARENRPQVYNMVSQANGLINTDPEKATQLYEEAVKKMIDVQRAEARSDPSDPTWSYTWVREPEREKAFREAMASAEIQKGSPLTTPEIRRLKQYYENTWTEIGGESLFDITNIIPAEVLEAVFSPLTFKFWKNTADEAVKLSVRGLAKTGKIETAVKVAEGYEKVKEFQFPLVSYLRRQTVSTIANKRQRVIYDLFSRISSAYNTTEDLVPAIDEIARAANRVKYMPTEEAARAAYREAQQTVKGLQNITFDEFKQFGDLLDASQGGIEFTKWRDVYKEAQMEIEPNLRRLKELEVRRSGKFTSPEAIAAEVNRQVRAIMESPVEEGLTLGVFSEKFAGAYTDSHRLYKGSVLLDDSISGQVALLLRKIADDQSEDALVRKIFSQVADKVKAGERLTLADHFNKTLAAFAAPRSAAAKATAMGLARGIEWFTWAGKKIVDFWSTFVLPLNPRWVVQNLIDSTTRSTITGTNPLDSIFTMLFSTHRELVDDLGFLPIDLGQSLARDGLDFSTSVPGRLVYGGWKPLPGPLGILSYYQYEVQRLKALRGWTLEEASVEASKLFAASFPEGSMMNRLSEFLGGVNIYRKAASGAIQDFNTSIEFTLRLRMFHTEYFKNIQKLEPLFKNIGMDALSPEMRKIAAQAWQSAESNPRKLSALIESMIRQEVKESPAAWTMVLPPGIESKMADLTPSERNLLTADIRNHIDILVDHVYKTGRMPEANDFVKFFDGYAEDAKNTINDQLSNSRTVREISSEIGTQQATIPDPKDVHISSIAVDREKVSAALERIGRKNRGRFDATKSFDDFSIAMSEMAPIELVPGTERHIFRAPDGKLRVTIGEDLVKGKTLSEIKDLMNEVTIHTFVQHEADFAMTAGFHNVDEFEKEFRAFITKREGPMALLNRNPDQFLTLVQEMEANPNLHRILERTSGNVIAYEEAYKSYLNNLPLDKLQGQAWFDMVEMRADKAHIPPAHTRQAAMRQMKQTKDIQLLINSKKLPQELEQELRNFLSMYDTARKDLGQFYAFTEPGPLVLSGDGRRAAWDQFYWRQAEAYDYGERLKMRIVNLVNSNPDEALTYLKGFNSDFYKNFLENHGITDFGLMDKGSIPVTNFKMVKNSKTYEIGDDIVRKDLYERFLSPEKKATILNAERLDLSVIDSQIPLQQQLQQYAFDSFGLTLEQSRMYSRIVNDHVQQMMLESGKDAEYFLTRMGFTRIEGHLRAPDALRQVQKVLDNEGRILLYGFGAKNTTDLIRQTSVMFYDDLRMIAQAGGERATDDILRLHDFLEKATGKKILNGKLADEHIQAFADSFQKYISFGEAPNSSMKKPFERFTTWMNKVNGNALDTTIVNDMPPDVLEVMDRMFTQSKTVTPESANRTMRVMAKNAGVEFKGKKDLLDIVNEAVAPIKKLDRQTLRDSIMATKSMTADQADAIATLIEYRARAWGALNNRPASDYLKEFKIVTTKQEVEAALSKMGENPKFKEWFKDSKVLDETGAPKIMYTGTPSGGFTKFDITKANNEANLWGPGFYFTENTEIAGEYATRGRDYIDMFIDFGNNKRELTEAETARFMDVIDEDIASIDEQLGKFKGMTRDEILNDVDATVETANLKIQRDYLQSNKEIFSKHIENGRLDTVTIQAWANDTRNQTADWAGRLERAKITGGITSDRPTIMPVYLSIQNPFDLDKVYTREEAKQLMQTIDPYVANWLEHSTGAAQLNGEDLYDLVTEVGGHISKAETNKMFQAAGYDGFTHIGGGRFIIGDTRRHRVFVALEPEQIKSVFNSGEFGISEADILNKFNGLGAGADRRMPAYEQLRNAWDKMDDDDKREVFMWLTERTLTDPLSGVETLVAKSLGEKPEGWIEATSDLNALTAINNSWGHDAGDTLISGIGQIAKEEVSKVDGRVFRVGGDEFSYWFPNEAAAKKAMAAIDERVQDSVFIVGGKRRRGFTVSYGIAEDAKAADAALYVDKQRRVALGQRPLVRDTIPASVMALDKRSENLKALVGQFTESDGKRVIAIFNGADFATLPHELGHMFRKELPEADLRIIEQATGLREGDFEFLKARNAEYKTALEGRLKPEALAMDRPTYDAYFKKLQADSEKYVKAEEQFADGFVRYLRIGQSPIPELQTVFEKFKNWLREIWRSIKGNADLSMKMTPEVRGVYDRLFELPFGQVATPGRYTTLADVPHDLAATIFKSEASNQIVENLNAAFDVWKQRHELQGIPQAALKDFSTAKAFVKQQFDETTGELADQYRLLLWRFEQFEDTMMDDMAKRGFISRAEKTVEDFFAPPVSNYHVDGGVKTFMRNGVHNRAIYENTMAVIQEWRDFLTKAADAGSPFKVLTKEEAAALKEWSVQASENKAKLMEMSINGGKHQGVSVEGALKKTNRVMLDYQDRNNFDALMKNFFPFWMFPSRSLPFWVDTLKTHPQIIALYQKLKKMSESEAYQAGAVTSTGLPLPSLDGYIPVPGLDMWINPLAPMSFRYLLDMQSYSNDMLYKVKNQADSDENAYSYVAKQFMETSPIFGFTPGPWVSMALKKAGVKTQAWSLIPQTNLIPPWYLPEFIRRSEEMMNLLAPEPDWHDFLVERSMLEEANQYIQNTKLSETEKKSYLNKVSLAIANKGDDPLWQEAYQKYVMQEKTNNIQAFFTGFYPKNFSDSQADLLQARNEVILRQSAMNNSFQANIFGIPLNEQLRWDSFRSQSRVDTPEGWLYHLYGDIGWVTNDEGRLVNDPKERAKLVAARIDQDNKARAYYMKAADLERWKNKELAALPIGASWDQTRTVLDKYYGDLTKLENDLMPPYRYYGSNKPVALLEQDIRNLWWRTIAKSVPTWDGEEDYAIYEQRVQEWGNNLPKNAQILMAHFERSNQVQNYFAYADVDQPLDPGKIVKSLIQETNYINYQSWKLENDDVFTALNAVWKENYWNKYWDAVGALKNEERDLAEIDFHENNPPPDLDTLYQWVITKYGPDRFSRADIQRWVNYDPNQKLEIYNIDERHLQDVGEVAITREKIWDILSWAGPGKQRNILQDAFVSVGGKPDDLDRWYNAPHGLAWDDDPAHVNAFYDQLVQAASNVNLRAPNKMQIEQFLNARQQNDTLNLILEEKLGKDYQDVVNVYFYWSDKGKSEFSKWKRENRDSYKTVKQYFYLREEYGYTHKLWASYYQWKPKPVLTNQASGPVIGGTPQEQGLYTPTTNSSTPQVPTALLPPKPNTFSFGPQWPSDMLSKVSPSLIREINDAVRGYSNLSSSARSYLLALYKTHKDWRPFIDSILKEGG